MWRLLYKLASPQAFYRISGSILPYLTLVTFFALAYGLIGGLYLAPADYQQGDGFRIIYVHVPAAFMSMSIYSMMAAAAVVSFIWKIKLADIFVKVSAPLGAWFTFLALCTGALWGKPMWGTYWIWDARLTSELILLFLYLGIIGLQSSIPDKHIAARAVGILVIVGVVNLPIIHYSVYWWNTLHQGDTLKIFSQSTIAPSMYYPLIAMILAFACYYAVVVLLRIRNEILLREIKTQWVRSILQHA